MYELQANTHAQHVTRLEHRTSAVINNYYLTVREVRVFTTTNDSAQSRDISLIIF